MQCNAKSKTTGKQCKLTAVNGMTKCRLHGGLSPIGANSPHFKHGRYSKHLPSQLLEKYKDAQKDKDLLNLREEIYLVDIRLKTLVEGLPDGGITHSWDDLKFLWSQFVAAYDNGDILNTKSLMKKISNMIETGSNENKTWSGIFSTVERRRRLVASESKRLTDMQQIITAERAMALIYAMLDIVRSQIVKYKDNNLVVDDALLSSISNGIRGLISIPSDTNSEEVVNDE